MLSFLTFNEILRELNFDVIKESSSFMLFLISLFEWHVKHFEQYIIRLLRGEKPLLSRSSIIYIKPRRDFFFLEVSQFLFLKLETSGIKL